MLDLLYFPIGGVYYRHHNQSTQSTSTGNYIKHRSHINLIKTSLTFPPLQANNGANEVCLLLCGTDVGGLDRPIQDCIRFDQNQLTDH